MEHREYYYRIEVPLSCHVYQMQCMNCAIDRSNTTAYRPQCNGMTERFNKSIISIMKMYVNEDQKDWDLWIPYALLAYRTAYHEVLQETPFYLTYGRHPRLPIDLALQTP